MKFDFNLLATGPEITLYGVTKVPNNTITDNAIIIGAIAIIVGLSTALVLLLKRMLKKKVKKDDDPLQAKLNAAYKKSRANPEPVQSELYGVFRPEEPTLESDNKPEPEPEPPQALYGPPPSSKDDN